MDIIYNHGHVFKKNAEFLMGETKTFIICGNNNRHRTQISIDDFEIQNIQHLNSTQCFCENMI